MCKIQPTILLVKHNRIDKFSRMKGVSAVGLQLIDLVVGAVGWVAHRCVRYDPIIDLSTHAPLVRGSIIPATCSSQEFRLDRVGPFFVFKVPVCGARFQCPLTGSLSHAA